MGRKNTGKPGSLHHHTDLRGRSQDRYMVLNAHDTVRKDMPHHIRGNHERSKRSSSIDKRDSIGKHSWYCDRVRGVLAVLYIAGARMRRQGLDDESEMTSSGLGVINMIPHDWTKLDSSLISKVKYIPNKFDLRGDLHVEYPSGKVYAFKDIPQHKVESMMHASSSGTYFLNKIRGEHNSQQVLPKTEKK